MSNLFNSYQKKTLSVSAVVLQVSDFNGTNAIDIFNIPEKSVITRAFVLVEAAGNSSLTLNVTNSSSSTNLLSNVVTTASKTTSADLTISTGTGTTVSVKPNRAVTEGEFVVIVEYIEYTLSNGMLTN